MGNFKIFDILIDNPVDLRHELHPKIDMDEFRGHRNNAPIIKTKFKLRRNKNEKFGFQIEEIEENKTLKSDFWDDSSKAQIVLKKIKFLKNWIDNITKSSESISDLEILFDFNKNDECSDEELLNQYNSTEEFLKELEFKTMLSDESDNMDAVLQVTAGAGGTESCDWAQMLMRMYVMFGEKNDFKVSKLNEQDGESAGIKTVTLKFEGEYAFGWLRGENGVHRLVRISPFDSNAKRHTSFASVYVYPLVDDSINIEINQSDIEINTFSHVSQVFLSYI